MTASRQVGTQLPPARTEHGTGQPEGWSPLKIKCPCFCKHRLFNCWGRITINQEVPLCQQEMMTVSSFPLAQSCFTQATPDFA